MAMNQMSTIECDRSPNLGPTVFVSVEVNGVNTNALVDTGSPATIISLEYILQILADQREQHVPLGQWKKQVLQRFSAPDAALRSYGGHRVDIVSQIPVQLRLGTECMDAVVLVQKGPTQATPRNGHPAGPGYCSSSPRAQPVYAQTEESASTKRLRAARRKLQG